MWMWDQFFIFIDITQIRLSTVYFDSTGGANYAATVSGTMHELCPEFELSEHILLLIIWLLYRGLLLDIWTALTEILY